MQNVSYLILFICSAVVYPWFYVKIPLRKAVTSQAQPQCVFFIHHNYESEPNIFPNQDAFCQCHVTSQFQSLHSLNHDSVTHTQDSILILLFSDYCSSVMGQDGNSMLE